ncbi:hypothetical protein [Amycolatopsis sp. WAC 04182]|uniref:hypothetical protein n=1 Tax=Amycolatopsis sp. WAC 04182 TaxID=2203198 RepID=UPI00131577C0|nr:hypothetical protein [Amycolatopsis sp. WAC 04182]
MVETILPIHPRTGLQAVGWRKARPGEDGEQPIWPIAGASDPEEGPEAEPEGDPAEEPEDEPDEEPEGDPEGAEDLGDKGKKALDTMKAKLRDEKAKRRAVEAERDTLKSGSTKNGEPDVDQIRREAETAAAAKANKRIVRSEIRAAATGKLADPKDALTFIDIDQFEVDENGEVDADEIADAIDDLIKNKPYLAAATAKRFQGTGDGGAARKAGTKPKQVTEAELKTMTSDQIVKAQNEGRLANLLGAG